MGPAILKAHFVILVNKKLHRNRHELERELKGGPKPTYTFHTNYSLKTRPPLAHLQL